MSRNGEQKTDLFEMEVIDGDFIWDFDELKQIYQPIASELCITRVHVSYCIIKFPLAKKYDYVHIYTLFVIAHIFIKQSL